jgi:hypothetical protein
VSEVLRAVERVLANWESGDLAGAVNRLRISAGSLRQSVREAEAGAAKWPPSNQVDRFLRGEGFVVLGMNRSDASPGLPFEAWAYRGPLDFDASSPVVFGLGTDPIEALNALAHQLAGVDEAQHPKERPDD